MAEAIIIVNTSQPTTAVDLDLERYTDADDAPSHEEGNEVGADLFIESVGDAQEKENNGTDDAAPDENAPAFPRARKNALRSPKTMMLSKLKPFSTPTSQNRKSNHFFNEPSPKSKPSPKVKGKSVLSPRALLSPKKPPVEPSPKAKGKSVLSPRALLSPKKPPVEPVEKKTAEGKLSLAVAPGRLGLSLKIDKQRGGALIVSIDPRCAFYGKVDVGDHIVGIDDRKVRDLNDFKVDSDKTRSFIVRRSKKASSENVTTESDGLKTTRAKTPKAGGDQSQQFSQVEMNSLSASLLSPTQSSEEDTLEEFEANEGRCTAFNCYTNRYSCASTVKSDSTSSIKTFLQPVTSLMECGQSHAGDYASHAGDISFEQTEEMNKKAPSIAQVSQLKIKDHAFIKRSNGEWTYSTVLDKDRGSITFAVDAFGNGKTITKHRWKSTIRLVASAEHSFESSVDDYESSEDDYESVSEEYSTSRSFSGSEDYSEDDSPLSIPFSPSAAKRKAQLKAMVAKKEMHLKAKKQEKKRRAKAAAAEAKRKERELKDAQELEVKLRLMHLEEDKLKDEEEAEKRRQRMNEEKMAKKMAEREEKKRRKLAKIEAEREDMRRRKLAEEEEKIRIALSEENDKQRVALIAKSEKEAKAEMKKLQKAKKQAAALEAQRQAELMFKNLEASSPVADVTGEVNAFVNDFFLCEM